jgi:glycosyltransferase involved in cell wall biosynthesis
MTEIESGPMSAPRRLSTLYLCYLSLDDPLVHTQVLAYLRGLAAAGHEIHLLTFETGRLTRSRRAELRRTLADDGIHWYGLRYHKRPSLPATVLDVIAGALYATRIARRHNLDVLHARSHVPAAMAMIAQRLLGRRRPSLIFDIRGLMADEYVDAGRWRPRGVPFRITKWVERLALRHADGVVVLTERIRARLFGNEPPPSVFVIPCCADLDALERASADRARIRDELGFGDEIVMAYVGKFGGWYMADRMAEFFAVSQKLSGELRFVILTQSDRAEIERELGRHGADGRYTIASAPPGLVGGYLAAADFGISFIAPAPSKASSSPTKIGEYLGAGLPVLSTAGVGDLDQLITPEVGVLVTTHSDDSYRRAWERIYELVRGGATSDRCRALARERLSLTGVGIPRYRALYEFVSRNRTAGS